MSDEQDKAIRGATGQPLDLDDQFDHFMRSVHKIPVNPLSTQWRESRRCFYAGAASVFYYISGVSAVVPEEEACKLVEAVHQQLMAFKERVKEDKD